MAEESSFLYDTNNTDNLSVGDGGASQSASQTSTAGKEFLPIQGEEFRFGNMVFTSKFDSGNLQKVEKVHKEPGASDKVGYLDPVADIEYNVWTRPDCAGSPYENGNRSWFYFGIRGYTPGKQIKINIMNMNKQGKLYSQGHSPIYRILPQRPNWERIKDRCNFEVVGTEFILTYYYRFPEFRGTVYFSFCYPWSYTESQQQMDALDQKFAQADENIKTRNENEIYYHRELFGHSLDGLRLDLLTVSSYHGISEKREPRYDPQLFPDKESVRCRNFHGKRVYVLTSRVHPGESPASFVYNGFLEFLLKPNDKRAIQLRKQYVFKFIPMLNPDGVVRGHYRTDSRGINLNRLYLDPVIELYPSIYAAKSLLVFHHVNNCLKRKDYIPNMAVIFKELAYLKKSKHSSDSEANVSPPSMTVESVTDSASPRTFSAVSAQSGTTLIESDVNGVERSESFLNRCSSADSSMTLPYGTDSQLNGTEHLNHPRLRLIPHDESGVAFYVDLHGHASKRGCFMYGNHFMDEDRALLNLLYPKLISMNSAHFDYGGCVFTEKNMYTKDKRDGHSKEGSGRVAIHKSIGIVHSYTLECNYNSGRLVNSIAGTPDGRITPPPLAGFPPKYVQAHFEEVGRAMAISAIDYTNTNPLSRLQYSELINVNAVKDWIRRTLRGAKGVSKFNRPAISINPKTMTRSVGTFNMVKTEPSMRTRQPASTQAQLNSEGTKTGFSFGRTPRFSEGDLLIQNQGSSSSNTNNSTTKRTDKDLGPVREAPRRSFSLPSPTVLLKNNKAASKSLGEVNQTRSYSLRLMHTMSRNNNTTVQILQSKKQQNGEVKTVDDNSVGDPGSDAAKENDPDPLVSEPTLLRYGTLAEISSAPTPQTNQFPVSKNSNVTKDITTRRIRKRSNHLGVTTAQDQAKELGKELGLALERTTLKASKRKGSGRKSKSKIPGPNVQVNCIDGAVTKNGLLQGANIKLTDRAKETFEKTKTTDPIKTAEMDNFEQELRQRMSTLKHPEAYWVEL